MHVYSQKAPTLVPAPWPLPHGCSVLAAACPLRASQPWPFSLEEVAAKTRMGGRARSPALGLGLQQDLPDGVGMDSRRGQQSGWSQESGCRTPFALGVGLSARGLHAKQG